MTEGEPETASFHSAVRKEIVPDDYGELSIGGLKDHIRDAGIESDPIALEALRDYEAAHKQRVTMLSWLDSRLTEAGTVALRVATTRRGYVAGEFFETHTEVKTVEFDRRIKEALIQGDLEVVETVATDDDPDFDTDPSGDADTEADA